MEDISKACSPRASVSMPSLDAADDYSDADLNPDTNSGFITTNDPSFVPVSSVQTFISTDVLSDSPSFATLPTVETSPPDEVSAEEPSEILQQDETLDSQSEEDPSIALDQFIKKIADEQLNSKRMDINTTEEVTHDDGNSQPSSDHNLDTESNEPVDMDIDTKDSNKDDPKNDSPVQQNSNEATSALSDTEKTPNDLLQDECIEEIQKEIDKIPPRKVVNTDSAQKINEPPVQNGRVEDSTKVSKTQSESQESVERMLCDDDDNIFEDKEKAVKDSSEALEDPDFIEKAQEEIKKLDVLVCGECHNTFYLVEEFVQHKKKKCQKNNVLISPKDTGKCSQIWGFILWKLKQANESNDHLSQWAIYQKWCKLSDTDKNVWIMAGESIQFSGKIANSQIIQLKKNDTPSIPEFRDSNKENADFGLESSANNIIKKGINKPVKLNNDVTIMPSTKSTSGGSQTNVAIRTTKVLSTQKQEFVVEKIVAKRFNPRKKTWEYSIKWENFGHDSNTWEPVSNLSHCKQLVDQFEEQLKRMKEEKAKQANASPKSRGRPPASHKQYKSYVPIAPKITNNTDTRVVDDMSPSSSSRPQRSSKQKALNQVKAWCGNISDEDSLGVKRKHEDDDSDEDYDEKRIKMEEESDESDKDAKSKSFTKKISPLVPKIHTPLTIKNGNTQSTQQILPSNILIPDANGVVRINQKQLPSLSSGVYIMSKTAGIIKLDSSTSKVATSGGQTIVKVAPKIGQTQIKIVKKEGNTTKQIIQVSPKSNFNTPIKVTPVKVTNAKINKIRKEIRKLPPAPPPSSSPKVLKKILGELAPAKSDVEEDTDDGLEPLPFPEPTDPLPTPESPPAEFILDPATGKIAGQEYVDKPVIIKEEPQPVPVPALVDVENIVQLAAADITEDDLENTDSLESQGDLETYMPKSRDNKPTIIHTIKTESGSGAVKRVVKYTTSGQTINDGSILNKALTHPGQRTSISTHRSSAITPQQQRTRIVQQKVINSMVGQRGPGPSHGVRTMVRQVISSPQSVQGTPNIRTRTVPPKQKYQVSQKPLASPLQPTRTYAAAAGVRQQIQSSTAANRIQTPYRRGGYQLTQSGEIIRKPGTPIARTASGHIVAPQKTQTVQYTQRQPGGKVVQRVVSKRPELGQQQMTRTVTPAKPKTVISMPSLTDDESTVHGVVKPKSQTIGQSHMSNTSIITKPEPMLETEYTEPEVTTEEVLQVNTATDVVASTSAAGANEEAVTDWSSFTMADSDSPIYVTGDDGTIYQVAGQNEQGQTILITQGPDGQQQCLLVTNEIAETGTEEVQGENETESVLGLSNSLNQEAELASETVTDVTDPLQIKTNLTDIEGIEDAVQDQVVAQVVRAEPPSPGGTHKVVVMLPDGNLMVTQVSPEEYASLELE